jgi:2-(1,2-epoxy-1,2-dihydrophenyl)acetyl-CoA isomerase
MSCDTASDLPTPPNLTTASNSTAPVQLQYVDEIALLTLNRAEAGNSIDESMASELIRVASRIANEGRAAALVVTGRGKLFCGGGDLIGFRSTANQGTDALGRHVRSLAERLHEGLAALQDLQLPWVSAVNGSAGGAGLSLVLASDIAFARPGDKFAAAYAELGLATDAGLSWWLPRKIGHALAVEMILGSRSLTAAEAKDIGLISAVIDGAEELFVSSVVDHARNLCRGTRASRSASLTLLRESWSRSLADQRRLEACVMGDLAGSDLVRARVLALGKAASNADYKIPAI